MRKSILNISLLAGILLLISCGNDSEKSQQAAGAQAQQAKPYPVIEIITKTVEGNTSYPVNIEGIVNSEIRAKVSGYINKVMVDEGEKVKKGQILFKLETQSLNQDAQAAQANVNAAQVEVDKLKPLVEKDIISEVQLETAKAKLQQAKSSYNSIAANIGYANIKSPVDGYVGSIRLREGALVSPTSQQPLTTVADIRKVYAYFSMNETDYLNFLQNKRGESFDEIIKNLPNVKLRLANGTMYSEEGRIETINSQVNANTGTVSFRAVFDNPSRILTNGNSGSILIPEVYKDAVVVPQSATFEQQGSIMVMKVGEDNKVTSSAIKTKDEIGSLYIVESGIKQGDKIVAKGVSKIRPGSEIKPQPVPFDSIAEPIEKVFK